MLDDTPIEIKASLLLTSVKRKVFYCPFSNNSVVIEWSTWESCHELLRVFSSRSSFVGRWRHSSREGSSRWSAWEIRTWGIRFLKAHPCIARLWRCCRSRGDPSPSEGVECRNFASRFAPRKMAKTWSIKSSAIRILSYDYFKDIDPLEVLIILLNWNWTNLIANFKGGIRLQTTWICTQANTVLSNQSLAICSMNGIFMISFEYIGCCESSNCNSAMPKNARGNNFHLW